MRRVILRQIMSRIMHRIMDRSNAPLLVRIGRTCRNSRRNGHAVDVYRHGKGIVSIHLCCRAWRCWLIGLRSGCLGFLFFKNIRQRVSSRLNVAKAVAPALPELHGRQAQIKQRPSPLALFAFCRAFCNNRAGCVARTGGKPRLGPVQHTRRHIEP